VKRSFYPSLAPVFVFIVAISVAASSGLAQRPALELQDVKQSASQTAVTLAGQVKNISSSDISGVTVYCDFQGAGGKVMRTEETRLDKDPLKPNVAASFSCSTKSSPDIRGYGLRFIRLFGGPLAVKSAAPKK
jgi:hypothetical protein